MQQLVKLCGYTIVICGVVLFIILAWISAPHAQTTVQVTGVTLCAPYAKWHKALTAKYGETLVFRGLAKDGTMAEIWVNKDTGKWTMIRVEATLKACAVTNGIAGTVTLPTTITPSEGG